MKRQLQLAPLIFFPLWKPEHFYCYNVSAFLEGYNFHFKIHLNFLMSCISPFALSALKYLVRLCRHWCFKKNCVFVWCISCACLLNRSRYEYLLALLMKVFSLPYFKGFTSHLISKTLRQVSKIPCVHAQFLHSLQLLTDHLSDLWS